MIVKKLQINANLKPHKKGDVISIQCSDTGIPLERYWRSRIKDSAIDKCVEFVDDKPAKSSKQKDAKS